VSLWSVNTLHLHTAKSGDASDAESSFVESSDESGEGLVLMKMIVFKKKKKKKKK
jgi:hypothetical protein